MNDKTEFSERLRSAMAASGYAPRPAVLRREFNSRYWGNPVTCQGASRWLRGLSIPSQDKLVVLAEWLSIEPQILRFGGEVTEHTGEQSNDWGIDLPPQEKETLGAYLGLPESKRQLAHELITSLAKLSRHCDLDDK
ncbi:transcriptional regulator [Stutzerimonas kirkiae]|uniref:Transcriptional regulator n=1 Tax=Stutzerimonas kirkiae TaxID=2211392 RepID=A0A4Q9R8D2_9GAMM|nr:transcriptional regulator [Stutzerimonas kirkiae]TBU96298.1 transcriptional regulator [Stutzerimonas kirkiae]TBV03419.1 transcriptional regulator [Stutzerimonas kirkiae]TBV04733.1 transcriptional regulator [Stutzerimonas kirkiae]TBV12941.1 transcriptional regulator [Stutzerimonas kirkiae]